MFVWMDIFTFMLKIDLKYPPKFMRWSHARFQLLGKWLDDEGSNFIIGSIHRWDHNLMTLFGDGGNRKWDLVERRGSWDMNLGIISCPWPLPPIFIFFWAFYYYEVQQHSLPCPPIYFCLWVSCLWSETLKLWVEINISSSKLISYNERKLTNRAYFTENSSEAQTA